MASVDRPESIEHRWDILYRDFPEIYDEFASYPYDPRPVDVVDARFDLTGKTVIDVGSGSGLSSLAIAERARYVVGVESEPAMTALALDRARRARVAHVAFVVADANKIPLADRCADLVTAFTAPHRTAEALRVLRPGGHVVRVDIPNGWYGGELNQVVAHATPGLAEGERLLADEGYRSFDFESVQEYGSTENVIRTYGFIFGRNAIDHLRRTPRTSIRWTFRVHYLRKA